MDIKIPRFRFPTLPAWSSCSALCRKHASLFGATTSAILEPSKHAVSCAADGTPSSSSRRCVVRLWCLRVQWMSAARPIC